MKPYIEIVGPCSKWVQGKGWVTQIPIYLIENAGFIKQEIHKNLQQKTFWQGYNKGKNHEKNNTR